MPFPITMGMADGQEELIIINNNMKYKPGERLMEFNKKKKAHAMKKKLDMSSIKKGLSKVGGAVKKVLNPKKAGAQEPQYYWQTHNGQPTNLIWSKSMQSKMPYNWKGGSTDGSMKDEWGSYAAPLPSGNNKFTNPNPDERFARASKKRPMNKKKKAHAMKKHSFFGMFGKKSVKPSAPKQFMNRMSSTKSMIDSMEKTTKMKHKRKRSRKPIAAVAWPFPTKKPPTGNPKFPPESRPA